MGFKPFCWFEQAKEKKTNPKVTEKGTGCQVKKRNTICQENTKVESWKEKRKISRCALSEPGTKLACSPQAQENDVFCSVNWHIFKKRPLFRPLDFIKKRVLFIKCIENCFNLTFQKKSGGKSFAKCLRWLRCYDTSLEKIIICVSLMLCQDFWKLLKCVTSSHSRWFGA